VARYYKYYALALILALVLFGPWIHTYFCSDDWPAFVRNMGFSWPAVPGWFAGLRSGAYRPVHDVFVGLCWRWFGLNPLGYRLVSIALYAGVSGTVGVMAHLLSGDGRIGTLSTLLFSAFATHAEPVLWFAATNELLAAMFVLIGVTGFVLFRKRGKCGWLVVAGLSAALGFASKETALLFPLLLVAYDVLWPGSRGRKRSGPFFAPLAAMLLLWGAFLLFRIPQGSAYTSAVAYSIPRLAMNLAYYALIGVLALPNNYAFLEAWPLWRASPWLPIGALLSSSGVLLIAGGVWVRERAWRIKGSCVKLSCFALLWSLVALGPVVFIVSERSIFLSSVGIALMFATLFVGAWDAAKKRGRGLQWAVAIAVVLHVGLNAGVLEYRSTWFGRSGAISERVLAGLERQVAGMPAGASIVLANLPDHTGYTFTFRNTFPSAAVVLGYNVDVQAVLDSELDALPPQRRAEHVRQLARESDAVVLWYRDGKLEEH
jgi:hypothetical protein